MAYTVNKYIELKIYVGNEFHFQFNIDPDLYFVTKATMI